MNIVTRAEWGAVHGRGHPTAGAKLHLFVHHAAQRAPARTLEAEMARWREYEVQHAQRLTPTNPRIGYTAGFGQSGHTFEGTGLGFIGAHTGGRNSSSWGVCFLLDGTREKPSCEAVQAYFEWRIRAIQDGYLAVVHDVLGHRDAVATTCPGDLVYGHLVEADPVLPAVPTGAAAVQPMPTLRQGSGGKDAPPDLREAVRELQRRLGMHDRHRTGFFGPVTAQTVREFQREKGLTVDGIIGPKSWAALGA